eukprot:scaffold1574_cov373-Prasinococcus_capsulatus_cf.AAC.9
MATVRTVKIEWTKVARARCRLQLVPPWCCATEAPPLLGPRRVMRWVTHFVTAAAALGVEPLWPSKAEAACICGAPRDALVASGGTHTPYTSAGGRR